MSSAMRIGYWQGSDQSQLPDPQALGLHPKVHVEHDRVGGNLFALDMKVMLREGHTVVAMLVEVTGLLAQVGQHPLIKIGAPSRHPGANFSLVADTRQVEYSNFHLVTSYGVAPLLRSPDCSRNRCRTVSGRYGDFQRREPTPRCAGLAAATGCIVSFQYSCGGRIRGAVNLNFAFGETHVQGGSHVDTTSSDLPGSGKARARRR